MGDAAAASSGDDGGECHAAQVVGADGEMDVAAVERFAAAAGLTRRGLSYAVVSIFGPQGSGKSTLLKHLFGTSFREMDALRGRHQTTNGIWIAKSVGLEPFTIVLDLEGTDGRERGQDDAAFEKQNALFALAVSDIVMINLWCQDIGREQGAIMPVLRTVFQASMSLLSPRKTTLMLVIRDKTKTPLELLTQAVNKDIQKIWDSVQKPEANKESALSELFNVEVTALSSYEKEEQLFMEQVVQLRQRFCHSIAPGGLAADRRGAIPASGFCLSALQIWKAILENKDLNLHAHKVMISTVLCEEIANEKLRQFLSEKLTDSLELDAVAKSGTVMRFGTKLGAIVNSYLSGYDMETVYFDEGVRIAKQGQLESSMLDGTLTSVEFRPIGSLVEACVQYWELPEHCYMGEASVTHCFTVEEIRSLISKPGSMNIHLSGLESLSSNAEVCDLIKTSSTSGKSWCMGTLPTVRLLGEVESELGRLIRDLPSATSRTNRKAQRNVLSAANSIRKNTKTLSTKCRRRVAYDICKRIGDRDRKYVQTHAAELLQLAKWEKEKPIWFHSHTECERAKTANE